MYHGDWIDCYVISCTASGLTYEPNLKDIVIITTELGIIETLLATEQEFERGDSVSVEIYNPSGIRALITNIKRRA